MKLFVTHPSWLWNFCERELRAMWYAAHKQWYGIGIDGVTRKDVYTVNMYSRIANKVFVVLGSQTVTDFDALFDLAAGIDRSTCIAAWHGVRVLASSRDSKLASTRTIQSIVHKSILTKLTGSRDVHREVDESQSIIEISVDVYKDTATVLLNTSGASLHERWYRTQQWEAPLKENIAAWLLMLSWRDKKSPLYDPFCGSGTVCIEWAMMALDIAPWLHRSFVFQDFPCFDGFVWHEVLIAAKGKVQKNPHSLWIMWSDIDTEVLEKARANAQRAWVEDCIRFVQKHFLDQVFDMGAWCVTNPPYGIRLDQWTDDLVADIDMTFTTYRLRGGFLLPRGITVDWFSAYNLMNGQQEVSFYVK